MNLSAKRKDTKLRISKLRKSIISLFLHVLLFKMHPRSATTRIPKTKDRMNKSIASTVSRSSEATYEIEINAPPKPAAVPLRENFDVRSNVKGGRRKKSVHTVPSHSASVRSGSDIVLLWPISWQCEGALCLRRKVSFRRKLGQ